ncbi:hypothetical protein WN943_029668 [Citrus x changshan-huyou]
MAPKKARGISMEVVVHQESEARCQTESSQHRKGTSSSKTQGDTCQSNGSGRGCAHGALEWGTGKMLHLEFDSEWKPMGQNASKFNSQLGVIAKNGQKVPLTYLRWSDMPDDILEYIWTEVEYKPHCLRKVGERWIDWKARVKAKWYTPFVNDKRLLTVTPSRVVAEQWRILVAYWSTEKSKSQFNERLSKISEDQQTSSIREDICNDVLGLDAHGRERMQTSSSRSNNINESRIRDEIRMEVQKEYGVVINELRLKYD